MTRTRVRTTAQIAGAVAVLSLTSCAAFEAVAESHSGDVRSITYPTGQEGLEDVDAPLPSWVPADATDVRGKVRTTGSERLLAMTVTSDQLPSTCVDHEPGAPIVRESNELDADTAVTYRREATLAASWWPSGVEHTATKLCHGKWWVAITGTDLYAFSPERTTTTIEK